MWGQDPDGNPLPASRGARVVSALALVLVSCAGQLPRPRLPQVEQATEAAHGGLERYQAHGACVAAAKSVDDLVRCMRDAGWDFIPAGAVFPEVECWQARDRGEIDRLPPHCFVRSPEHRRGESP
jgi:hypothetical protein